MAVNNPHSFETDIYFVTFTIYKWMHLFAEMECFDVVYKWFDAMKDDGHDVLGYVIMPNHVHVLIGYERSKRSINTVVGSGKRFMAYEIVNRLQHANEEKVLKKLAEGVNASDRKRGQLHEVFEGKTDILRCYSYKFVAQKLNYIHSNPMSKKWALVSEASEYVHSSAGFYLKGVQGSYNVVDVNKWICEKWK